MKMRMTVLAGWYIEHPKPAMKADSSGHQITRFGA